MKMQPVLMVITIIVCCFIRNVADGQVEGQCSGGTNDLSIGERMWPPVSNGMVFVDGRYISPPYVISRREGLVFVNKHQIAWTFQWPPKKNTLPSPPKEMPVMPSTITKETTKYDKHYLSYIYNVQQYLTSRYGETQGIVMMAEVYQGMPCVRSAKFGNSDSNTLEVFWMNGAHSNIRLAPIPVGKLNITKEQAESFIDKTAEIFVKGLSNGDYYMLEGGGV